MGIIRCHKPMRLRFKSHYETIKMLGSQAVADLDKERPYDNPLVRSIQIPHLHDWKKMSVCLINFNKGKYDEGCLKFCNILKWSATV